MFSHILHTHLNSKTMNLFKLDKETHRLCLETTRNVGGFLDKKCPHVSAMRNGVKFDATPSLPRIGVVCLVKGKVGALKSEDSFF